MGADAQGEIARALALRVLGEVAIGDRVVVRALHGDGASDALGELVARTPDTVTIDTRRGLVAIDLADVVAAKRVPPPPTPRSRLR
ncbi:hypothetical protein DEJ13_06710 [Curtobacterium sp. MCLR17_007]|uniref:hypothetical protein n=1 Tax=unclassified Curtobacterium TaxID=257496 RepID=UPI0007016D4A|nr:MULTISPECIES: hypothetical protein [unclassified Curtobacterium]KQS08247.1 hypothetical protein ASG04_14140 [Curtobacterium sp. Leaf183]WIB61518.1 hypothetical protein DEJ13_06710 [Curtobacterium sp. MCLR17_007]